MDLLRPMERDFYEELSMMPFLEKCIVLGIATGVKKTIIIKSLRISNRAFYKLCKEKDLKKWKLFRINFE